MGPAPAPSLDLFGWLVLESFHVDVLALGPIQGGQLARALEGYDYGRIAQYQEEDVERLARIGIIRHRGKIRATIAQHAGPSQGAGGMGRSFDAIFGTLEGQE